MSLNDSITTEDLLAAAAEGDQTAVERLLALHRSYLRRVVDVRMEPQLRARIDPSDVVQEAMLVASCRIEDFLCRRPTSFRIWLRQNVLERLVDERRHHRALRRDPGRDIAISDASSMAIAKAILQTTASQAMMRRELQKKIKNAMQGLSETDRDIILLHHCEQLTNAETAEALEITAKAASARYARAVLHLSSQLKKLGVAE